jgi:hypothetical protein
MGWEIILVVGLFIAIGVYLNRKENQKAVNSEPKASEPTKTVAMRPSSENEDDAFLGEIKAARKSSEKNLEQSVAETKADLEKQFQDDLALKAKLSKLAKANEFDSALVELWGEIKHYSAREANGHKNHTLPLSVTSTEGSGSAYKDEGENQTVKFTHQSSNYEVRAHTKRFQGFIGDDYTKCHLTLVESGVEVFAVDCKVKDSEWTTSLVPTDVTRFIKSGNWGKMLIEMLYKVKESSAKFNVKMKYSGAEKIKGNFEG